MSKPPKSDRTETQIQDQVRSGPKRAPANTDDMPTAVNRRVVARLTVVEGPGTGATFNLYDGSHAIGRDASNQIALAFGDTTVHRRDHAFIAYMKGHLELRDNGKPNGVMVNGVAVAAPRRIGPGDRIRVGNTTLRVDPMPGL